MTLIVGIKCRDGIVLAADSAATLGNVGERTIRQNSATKLTIVGGSAIIGTAGSVGLGQRFAHDLETHVNGNLRSQHPTVAMTSLSDSFHKHIGKEVERARPFMSIIGNGAATGGLMSQSLVAIGTSGGPSLFQFDHQASPEAATDQLPFVAIGSGQSIADPFLAFIRRIFWANDAPSLSEGIFAAVWTIEHAIQTHPGGVDGQVQVAIHEGVGKGSSAKMLANSDVEETHQAIAAAETTLRGFRNLISERNEPTDPIPMP